MKYFFRLHLFLAAIVVCSNYAFSDSKQMLVKPPFHHSQLSPDGQLITAYEDGGNNNPKIVVYDVETKQADRVSIPKGDEGTAKIYDLKWVSTQTLAIITEPDAGEQGLYLYTAGERNPKKIVLEGTRQLLAAFPEDSTFFVVENVTENDTQIARILKYDARSAETPPTEIYRKEKTELQGVFDSEGNLRLVRRISENGDYAWFSLYPDSDDETQLTELPHWATVYGIDAKTDNVIMSLHRNNELPAIYVFGIEENKVLQKLADNPSYSLINYASPVFDPESHEIVGLHMDAVNRRSIWTDSAINYIQSQLDEKLPGSINRILGWSDDRSKFLVQRFIPNFPSPILHVDQSKDAITPVFLNGPPIDPEDTGATQLVNIPNREGVALSAVITVPATKPSGPLPLLVWIGPGVWNRLERPEWHPEANYFASQGNVVLRVNYRGIDGALGPLATDKQSLDGLVKTFHDIEDCVKALVDAGVADPDKISIAGEADGAWAAGYAPIASPDIYRAVLCFNGIFDVVAYHKASSGNNEVGGGMTLPFANQGTQLSTTEIERLSISQNLENYPKSVFTTMGNWSSQPYKNQVYAFTRSLKKQKVSVKNNTDDWWGPQLEGEKRINAFQAAAKFLRSAVK